MLYQETGEKNKEAILFIHGEGLGKWMWSNQMTYFNKYHCILIDLPGHGQNKLIYPFIMEETVEKIKDILDKIGVKKINIIGHSLGANIAVEIAATYPELVSNIVLTGYQSMASKRIINAHKKRNYQLSSMMLKKKVLSNMFCKKMGFTKEMSKEFVEEYKRMDWKRLYSIFNEYIENLGIPEKLLNSKIPALFMVGEFEEGDKKESICDLMVAMPRSEGVIIKGLNNSYPWLIYRDFNEIAEKWISSCAIDSELIIEGSFV